MKKNPETHVPSPSIWPMLLAVGLLLIADGVIFSLVTSIIGVVVLLTAVAGWALENRAEGAHDE
jgi:cytochrome c oxidase subunit 1